MNVKQTSSNINSSYINTRKAITIIKFPHFPSHSRVDILTVTMMNLTLIQIFPRSLIPMSFQHMSITRLSTVTETMIVAMDAKALIWMKSMWLQKSNEKCDDEERFFIFSSFRGLPEKNRVVHVCKKFIKYWWLFLSIHPLRKWESEIRSRVVMWVL
jgi:hypothetical protein